MSIKEFTKAAKIYDSGKSGIYEMCKYDYPKVLKELKNKKLRVLHDNSFIDDPTRIIRGLKFAMRFNFELEEHTKKLQDEYLKNINYDMSYKRIKKELIETFNAPLSNITKEYKKQRTFEKFINEKIYKLVTPNDVEIPSTNIVNKQPRSLYIRIQLQQIPKQHEVHFSHTHLDGK